MPVLTNHIECYPLCPGLSSQAPITFASFGSYLGKLNDLSAGYRFVLMGKSLLQKLGANESVGEVISIVSEILSYCQSSRAANELRIEGEQAAISVGDMNWACLNRAQYCAQAFGVGTHLSNVNKVNILSIIALRHWRHP